MSKKDVGVYVAPVTGYYKVSSHTTRLEKTGRQTMQTNLHRKWWQIWKPKLVLRDEHRVITEHDENQIKFVQAGDEIVSSFTPNRI